MTTRSSQRPPDARARRPARRTRPAPLTRVRRVALDRGLTDGEGGCLCFESADRTSYLLAAPGATARALAGRVAAGEALDAATVSATLATPLLSAAAPLPLRPVAIAKAWGEERWFTGIEARGVAAVGTTASSVPLPWLLAARTGDFGGVAVPILAKVLAPTTCPDSGDLYFEVHRAKEEVYVVTAVDRAAWPDGRGRVRYGFDASARARLGEAGFREAFAAAARAHARALRALGASGRDALSATDQRTLDDSRRLREQLEEFVNVRTLAPGDVVRVPPGLPHGLMHGVRVLEFQTPDYERRVLYASQPLDAGETERGLASLPQLRADVPADPPPATAETAPGVRSGCIARMRDFVLHRFELEAGARAVLPAASHGVLVVTGGSLCCGGLALGEEAGALLPGPALACCAEAGAAGAGFLLALPR